MSVHPPIFWQVTWHTESDTQDFAKAFVTTHDLSNAVVELRGDLGAGKTTLARYLLQALGVSGRIKSPTYSIVETYTGHDALGQDLAISHFDFYRFKDPQEWEDAGFRDLFAAPGLKLIEWADQARAFLPRAHFVIAIELGTNAWQTQSDANTNANADVDIDAQTPASSVRHVSIGSA